MNLNYHLIDSNLEMLFIMVAWFYVLTFWSSNKWRICFHMSHFLFNLIFTFFLFFSLKVGHIIFCDVYVSWLFFYMGFFIAITPLLWDCRFCKNELKWRNGSIVFLLVLVEFNLVLLSMLKDVVHSLNAISCL